MLDIKPQFNSNPKKEIEYSPQKPDWYIKTTPDEFHIHVVNPRNPDCNALCALAQKLHVCKEIIPSVER